MVLADSHRVPRVPWYLGVDPRKPTRFRIRGCYPLWLHFPEDSTNRSVSDFPTSVRGGPDRSHNPGHATLARLARDRFGLFPFRSPLLRESRLLSFPRGTEMVHFPRLASHLPILFREGITRHFIPCWVSPFGNLRIEACLRLTEAFRSLLASFIASRAPRHPPYALSSLTTKNQSRFLKALFFTGYIRSYPSIISQKDIQLSKI